MGEDTNEYKTPEEIAAEKMLASFEKTAHEGALFTDWARSYCTIKFLKWVDEQISDAKNSWISAKDRESAEAIRLQTQSYTKMKNWILAKIREGEVASEGVMKLHAEGVEMEGMIKPLTREERTIRQGDK